MALVRKTKEGEQIRLSIGDRDICSVIVKDARGGRVSLVLNLHPAVKALHEAAPPEQKERSHAPSQRDYP